MRFLSTILLWVMVISASGLANAKDQRPWNIVLLMAEDMSPHLGSYGDATAHTPNLDRLAQVGVRYTRAFTTSGVCATSRAAIIMGPGSAISLLNSRDLPTCYFAGVAETQL